MMLTTNPNLLADLAHEHQNQRLREAHMERLLASRTAGKPSLGMHIRSVTGDILIGLGLRIKRDVHGAQLYLRPDEQILK